uniref:Uncharacterized protein n=1 Tax=Chromera velia CCMP2878 TaxID=1169474 RepID=A0A0G4HFI0_9ALVE|eukprot:Cvel_27015.t1-p1 / transcript=Cvel_27015.t1 / gene=Cvel_27015 / organism=Chromera_velia_CCMP2878 / gene_product=hypothetical protein / transcript_product=hypothetical protein / location=Cvel_scaffold3304:2910-3329(-) / protein_length=140 / sequence_SO=supercontig / SO=protein_coding / is_pseudo=false
MEEALRDIRVEVADQTYGDLRPLSLAEVKGPCDCFMALWWSGAAESELFEELPPPAGFSCGLPALEEEEEGEEEEEEEEKEEEEEEEAAEVEELAEEEDKGSEPSLSPSLLRSLSLGPEPQGGGVLRGGGGVSSGVLWGF